MNPKQHRILLDAALVKILALGGCDRDQVTTARPPGQVPVPMEHAPACNANIGCKPDSGRLPIHSGGDRQVLAARIHCHEPEPRM
jgi:hypothetical protein